MASDTEKKMAAIVARCWVDDDFKHLFIADPKSLLASAEIKLPAKVGVTVVEDLATHRNIVLADKPLPSAVAVETLPPAPNLLKLYSYVYTKSLSDPKFKKQFKADPVGTVEGLGYPLPDGFTISVYEDSDTQRYFALPARPSTTVRTEALAHMVMLAAPVNANVNVNANTNVNINVDANINAALQVNAAAAAAVVVAVVVLI